MNSFFDLFVAKELAANQTSNQLLQTGLSKEFLRMHECIACGESLAKVPSPSGH